MAVPLVTLVCLVIRARPSMMMMSLALLCTAVGGEGALAMGVGTVSVLAMSCRRRALVGVA